MSRDHTMGKWLHHLKPGEFNTLKDTFTNEQLSEKTKFICYSFMVGHLIQQKSYFENELRGEKKFNDPWSIKITCLIDWYKDIFTEQEIIEGFKELRKNNIYVAFDIEEILHYEREEYK